MSVANPKRVIDIRNERPNDTTTTTTTEAPSDSNVAALPTPPEKFIKTPPNIIIPSSPYPSFGDKSASYIATYKTCFDTAYKQSYTAAYMNAFNSFNPPPLPGNLPMAAPISSDTTETKERTPETTTTTTMPITTAIQKGGEFEHDSDGPEPDPIDHRDPHEEEGPDIPLEDFL